MQETDSRPRRFTSAVRAFLGNPWVKTALTLVLLGFLLYWLRGQMPFLKQGFEAIGRPHWGWLTVALVFSFLSMSSFASVQKTLLGSAGVRVGYWDSLGLILVANSFSTCIPGGQVVGATLTYRKTRAWGASRVIASWQLVISGILATTGLVLLALGGFFLVGTVSNPFLLAASGLGMIAIVAVIQWVARNPDRIEGVLLAGLARVNRWRRKPLDAGADAVRGVVEQAEAVEMTRRQLGAAFAWSLLNWVADIGCLWAAALTVGAEHSIGGLCIAYVTGKVVGTAPITPGGLGTVEVALITALTAGGLTAGKAFAAVFVYRIVSFVLVAIAGWIVFALAYRGSVGVDPDDDEVSADATGGGASSGAGDGARTPARPVAVPASDPVPTGGPGRAPVGAESAVARPSESFWPVRGRTWRPTGTGATRTTPSGRADGPRTEPDPHTPENR